ncbi:hypothetical protein PVJ1_00036 [Psychrobacillus phage PVJ1]|nr:hypothetical protein PVJ1_00036 [Psychrobacillus phage PVJ1]
MILLIVTSMTLIILAACNSSQTSATDIQSIEPIIDVTQYSRITPEQLKEKLGEPIAVYDENWSVPTSGAEYPLQTYDYDLNGYYTEFLVIEDAVVRMNIYASDNPDNAFAIENKEEMFALLNIDPRDSLIEVEKNAGVLRYSSVSDHVGGVWTLLSDGKADTIKITYNFKYFD